MSYEEDGGMGYCWDDGNSGGEIDETSDPWISINPPGEPSAADVCNSAEEETLLEKIKKRKEQELVAREINLERKELDLQEREKSLERRENIADKASKDLIKSLADVIAREKKIDSLESLANGVFNATESS